MSPAHRSAPRRWLVLGLVVGVVVVVAVVARTNPPPPALGPPPTPGALVAPPGAESSAWYCTGQSTAAGQVAVGSVQLTNTGAKAVAGSITSLSDSGARVATPVSVPGRGQYVAGAPTSSGTWVSQTVVLSGGGVAVTQAIRGPSGWSVAPCLSGTSPQWYFPSGTTAGSDALYVALFNPTSTPDVVDLSFVTPSGILHPISFQGIVLQPQQTQVENVGVYVQNQASVATTVVTRTGRVVASETQVFGGSPAGLANLPGSPHPERQWSIPQSQEVAIGHSALDIFNPGGTTEDVTVRTRLVSGPLPPFSARVAPDATWVLTTSAQTRIPKSTTGSAGNYTTLVSATGGAGVVVGRMVAAPTTAPSPQAGMALAVDALSAASPSHRWVVPPPGSAASPATPGAAPDAVAVANPGGATETYVVSVMTRRGLRTLTRGRLPPSTFISLNGPVLASAGLRPLLVAATGTVAVSENLDPTGAYGVVTMPGIPLGPGAG